MAEIVLTPGQRAAVESRGCALLVAAAAGSGKTRVLIDRVLDQVIREGRCVDEFLLITFTQAAAAELRGKLLAELNRRLAADPENRHLQRQLSRVYLAQISTVHSFCAALLRDYAHVLELPADFRLADEQEAAALRERAVRAVLEEAYADPSPAVRAALDLPGAGRDDRALQELIVRVYTNLQCYPDPAATADRWEVMLDVTDCTDPGRRSGASGCCGSCSAACRAMRPCCAARWRLLRRTRPFRPMCPCCRPISCCSRRWPLPDRGRRLRASRRISAVSRRSENAPTRRRRSASSACARTPSRACGAGSSRSLCSRTRRCGSSAEARRRCADCWP